MTKRDAVKRLFLFILPLSKESEKTENFLLRTYSPASAGASGAGSN
jgi:hypothetical protein